MRPRSLRSYAGLASGAICVCFVLVGILGALQFKWIGQVSDSQRETWKALLGGPMTGSIRQIRIEAAQLLRLFAVKPANGPSESWRSYLNSYLSWHTVSDHALAVKRVLFYDTPPEGPSELNELFVGTRTIKPVSWDRELAIVRRHIDSAGFNLRSMPSRMWTGTWMFLPSAMAIYRPVARFGALGAESQLNVNPVGFLILQLDLDFIRERLIPRIVTAHFDSLLGRGLRFNVSIALDSKDMWVYEPTIPDRDSDKPLDYSLKPQVTSALPNHARPPDSTYLFPLRQKSLPKTMVPLGAVQRVSLRNRGDLLRIVETSPIRLGQGPELGSYGKSEMDGWLSKLRESGQLARLFVIAERPYVLSLRATHEAVSLEEAVNRRYKHSVAIGVVLLLLLVATMATVVISQRKTERLAAMQVEAAASQSHQLRNPLAAIALLAENMANGTLGAEERVVHYGEKILEYGERLTEIVDRTARIAALEGPIRPYRLAGVNVSEIARDAFEEARPLFRDAGFVTECAFAEDLPLALADPQALRLALGDLLGNARKYGLPGRWVRIETARPGSSTRREVQIQVKDRGRGIPAREAKMVLEPFYRARDVADSSIPGSGLGLALVRSAVEGMGGSLTLVSEVGRGSVFTISLPCAPSEGQ